MRRFHATFSQTIPAQLLNAIADRWKHLRHLLLHRYMAEQTETSWTDEHDAAVVKLVRKLPNLTHLVCVNGHMRCFAELCGVLENGDTDQEPSDSSVALRLLWVTDLSGASKNAVFRHCPTLCAIHTGD
jgi:hypothetical protein